MAFPRSTADRRASSPTRRSRVFLIACLVLATALPESSMAQEVRHRKGLFDWLFGRQERQQPDVIQIPARKRAKTKKRKSSSITTLSSDQAAIPKNADARHVLVVGDFLAAGLAEGLQQAFQQDPATVIDGQANTASGLVRDDYFSWPDNLATMLKQTPAPALVVIMIGANDRQQMKLNGAKEKFDTPAWNEGYSARVANLIATAKGAHVPFVWVGLPSFRSTQTSTAALQFNVAYRNETEKAGGEFVDIWDGFVDENGKFIVSGSDINGQPARLRTSDGIGMTGAGKRKVAFYAEKPIRKILGDPLTVEKLIKLDGEAAEKPDETATVVGPIVRTPPISLGDPELDGGNALLGAPGSRIVTSGAVFSGIREQAPTGRVDDFNRPAL